jgi:hypothetical protein
MSKRPTKPRPRAAAREIAYRPEVHDELFRLAAPEWRRPRSLRVSNQARGLTLDATFRDDRGFPYALRVRIRRYADGTLGVAEESLKLRFHLRSEGAAT